MGFYKIFWQICMHTMCYSKQCYNDILGNIFNFSSVQFSSVAQSCPTLWDPMNRSTPGLPVHHQLPEFTQTHVHRVGDTIQPSHALSSPFPPARNPSQHQNLFQWVNFLHEVAKVLEFQIPYDYTVEVTNRFKGLDLIDSAWRTMERGSWHSTGGRDQDHP